MQEYGIIRPVKTRILAYFTQRKVDLMGRTYYYLKKALFQGPFSSTPTDCSKLKFIGEKLANSKYGWSRYSKYCEQVTVISGDTPYLSVFSPNAGKYGPEKTPYLDIFHAVQVGSKKNKKVAFSPRFHMFT